MLATELDVDVNGDVTFAVTVRNDGDDPIDLEFRNGQTFDFAVFDDDGTERWRWSDGRMFTQALRSVTLAPGESESFEAVWEQPPTGSYEVEATLEAANRDASERAAFTI